MPFVSDWNGIKIAASYCTDGALFRKASEPGCIAALHLASNGGYGRGPEACKQGIAFLRKRRGHVANRGGPQPRRW
jgi:hypothetical protein